jgi:hypothetical protein
VCPSCRAPSAPFTQESLCVKRPHSRTPPDASTGFWGGQEAKHFTLLSERLVEMGSEYGAVRVPQAARRVRVRLDAPRDCV